MSLCSRRLCSGEQPSEGNSRQHRSWPSLPCAFLHSKQALSDFSFKAVSFAACHARCVHLLLSCAVSRSTVSVRRMLCPAPGECLAPLFAPHLWGCIGGQGGLKQPLSLLCSPGSLLSSYPPGPRADINSLLRTAPTLTLLRWAFCSGCSAGTLPSAAFLGEISSSYK